MKITQSFVSFLLILSHYVSLNFGLVAVGSFHVKKSNMDISTEIPLHEQEVLQNVAIQNLQFRQDFESNSGGDDEQDVESLNSGNLEVDRYENKTVSSIPLFPVFANIVKSIVYGGENYSSPLNVTHTIQHAVKLFWKPFFNERKSSSDSKKRKEAIKEANESMSR